MDDSLSSFSQSLINIVKVIIIQETKSPTQTSVNLVTSSMPILLDFALVELILKSVLDWFKLRGFLARQ